VKKIGFVFQSLDNDARTMKTLATSLCALTLAGFAGAAEWQWSAQVTSVVSPETDGHPRAFLWIPPNCARVRAVVVGQHNMLEEPLLEHPTFRATLAELGVAEIWVTPALGGAAKFGAEEVAQFDGMFRALAAESGYTELAQAPVVVIGHSALAEFPYLFAARQPERTLATISLKGSWPDMKKSPSPGWTSREVAGVPLLLVSGEYEWADERAGKSLAFRREFPAVPFSMFADAGGGHFDMHDRLAEFLALYLRKVAQFRLPRDAAQPLRALDAAREGWLVERWRQDRPPRAPAAPVSRYSGKARDPFWCFDEEYAHSTEKMQAAYAGRKAQLLGYEQAGRVVEQVKGTHQQVTLDFLPDPKGDGLTFKLRGVFLDTVPAGRPERWTQLKAGAPIEHATGGGPVVIRRICGPVAKLDDETFALHFDRVGTDNPRRSNEIWLLAEHPGDATFKRAVQQAVLHFPLRNEQGAEQQILFPPIPDQRAGAQSIKLSASSSAGAKVQFYVREGPAEIEGDTLKFTAIPPRAKFPVKVTVVAWQWGRNIEPKLKSAAPVERMFAIVK
jgi:hypothetical protein